MTDPLEPAVTAALQAAIEYQKQARDVLWMMPSSGQARAMLVAAAPFVAAAERERITAVLRVHYLAGITCDRGRHEDSPVCACSDVFLGWHRSTGEAVEAWIGHVMEAASGEDQERAGEDGGGR